MMDDVLGLWLLLAVLLSGFYVLVMYKYISGWKQLPVWSIPENFSPKTKVTVIIPARNEAENLPALITSLQRIDYPTHLFEVIFVDDFSMDTTADVVEMTDFKLIKMEDYFTEKKIAAHKKKGIELAIENAKGELIVTTDADCEIPENWLLYFASYFEVNKVKIMAAPVNFHKETSLLEKFQSLDFTGMMGVTAAGIQQRFMYSANGANLAYDKTAFDEVGGFTGNEKLASGDDIFLMQKIAAKYPDKVGFIKNPKATVFSLPQPTVTDFFNQRLRWATKSTAYDQKAVTAIWIGVFLLCASIVLSFFLLPFLPKIMLPIIAIPLFTKLAMDYVFLKMMTSFFGRNDLMKPFFVMGLMHIVYVVVVGFLASFKKKYAWKGRQVQ